jgi:hypothetical protein
LKNENQKERFAMEFYCYSNGQWVGPVNSDQLKDLANPSVITHNGQIYLATKIRGVLPSGSSADDPEAAHSPTPTGTTPQCAPKPDRSHRSCILSQRAAALERASQKLSLLGGFTVVLGVLMLIVGVFLGVFEIVSEAVADNFYICPFSMVPPNMRMGAGLTAIGLSVIAFIFAQIVFFFATLGHLCAARE